MRFLALLIFTISASIAFAEDPKRQMTVTAEGVVNATPDMARVQIGVQTAGPSAQIALGENSKRMDAVFSFLKEQGIEERDMQTTQFSIHPQWKRIKASSSNQTPSIEGYIVSNSINLRLRDLEKLGVILDKVTQDGANNLGSVQFDVSNRAELMDQARVNAVKAARARAELLSSAAGGKLGDILLISESGGFAPQPRFARAEADVALASVPIAEGELSIRAMISLTYELE